MSSDRPRILVLAHPLSGSSEFPEMVVTWKTERLPASENLIPKEWDYLHYAIDAQILDQRVYSIAAEYIKAESPDMLILSSPARRFLTGVYGQSERIFEILCHQARKQALYAFGNKLFSRSLWSKMSGNTPAELLSSAFFQLRKIVVLSHPWMEFTPADNPDDAAFFRLVGHYVDE